MNEPNFHISDDFAGVLGALYPGKLDEDAQKWCMETAKVLAARFSRESKISSNAPHHDPVGDQVGGNMTIHYDRSLPLWWNVHLWTKRVLGL